MNKIKYNEKEEAFEIVYKIWSKDITVRFYVDSQDEIMKNISEIALQLEKVGNSRQEIARIVAEEGYYEGAVETLEKSIEVTYAYVDIDEDGVVICMTVTSADGYLKPLAVELLDSDFEVTGWVV